MERKESRDEVSLVVQRPLNVTQVQKFTQCLAGTYRPLLLTPTLLLSLLFTLPPDSQRPSLLVLCILTALHFHPLGPFYKVLFFHFCSLSSVLIGLSREDAGWEDEIRLHEIIYEHILLLLLQNILHHR